MVYDKANRKDGENKMVVKNKELRIYKGGIQLKEIAKVSNVHRNTISRWFNNSEMTEVQEGIVRRAVDEIKAKKGAL